MEDALNAANRCKFCTLKGRSRNRENSRVATVGGACVWISTSNMHIHSSIENVTTTILGWRTIVHGPTSTETRDLPLDFCAASLGTNSFENIEQITAHKQSIQNLSSPSAAIYTHIIIKGSLDEKLLIYERDPKSKRIDSPENRFVRQ